MKRGIALKLIGLPLILGLGIGLSLRGPFRAGEVVALTDDGLSQPATKVEPRPQSLAAGGSLTTLFVQDNGFRGNSFDLEATNECLVVTGWDFNFTNEAGVTGDVSIYWREGTANGFESTATGWNLLGTDSVTTAGNNQPTQVDVDDLVLPAGEVTGIYYYVDTYPNPRTGYTTGGPTTFYNADLELTTYRGIGTPKFGGATFSYRQVNTTVHYESCLSTADHFKCYKAWPLWPRFESRDVTLADQFEEKLTTVERPVTICNPVDKNDEGIIDPTAHLTCFDISDAEHQPPFEERNVVVINQFGEQELTVTEAQSLCVPSEKNGVPSELNLDHFKCYDVVHSGFAPLRVTLEDQFEKKETLVKEPVSSCNPVNKNSEGILHPWAHLTCYGIRNIPWWDQWFSWRSVIVENQFGVQRLLATNRQALCVPSLKKEIDPE